MHNDMEWNGNLTQIFKLVLFFSNRCMDSVHVLTTQKERTVNDARLVTMTDHGDQQQLMILMNADVCIQSCLIWLILLLFLVAHTVV